MTQRQKAGWAIRRAEELLERNRSPIDTFEGVLNKGDVRALNTLLRIATKSLRPPQRKTAR